MFGCRELEQRTVRKNQMGTFGVIIMKQLGNVSRLALIMLVGGGCNTQGYAATAINVGDGWHNTFMSETVGAEDLLGPFTFTSTTNVIVKVTDLYLDYERYDVLDFGSPIGTTSVPGRRGVNIVNNSPDSAFASTLWSHGAFMVGAGSHSIRIRLLTTGPGDVSGLAYASIRVDMPSDTPIPVPVQLSVATNSAIGGGSSMAVADLNIDGILDIAIINPGADGLSIGLGDGTGGFTLKTNIQLGTVPQGVVAGDFDNDGFPDLIATRAFGNAAIVLKGLGDGTFAAPTLQPFNITAAGGAVLLRDFNNDGKLDFVVALNNGFTTSLGDGAGGFSDAVPTLLLTTLPDKNIETGDFNNDGNLDLAEPTSSGRAVMVMLGNGDGTFGAVTNVSVPSRPATGVSGVVVASDLDKDGNVDLVVAQQATTNGLTILWGDGSGGFPTKTNYNLGIGLETVAVSDLNRDQTPDLVLGFSGVVYLMVGTGGRTFGPRVNFPGGGTGAIGIGDFNRDDLPDVATGGISVLLNETFPSLQILPPGAGTVLKWPTSALNFQLESTTNCAEAISWEAVGGSPTVVGGDNYWTNTTTDTARYYRLKR